MAASHDMVRWAGVAGILGALAWTVGDALIVGGSATADAYPLLMRDYADRIHFEGLPVTVSSSEQRLALGALVADAAIPLYLAGSWHFFQGVRAAGAWLAWPIFGLLICGNAWSPLGHAAFYFVAMVYKTILVTPAPAHDALLTLGDDFNRLLLAAWLLPVVTIGLALTLLAVAIARGGTRYPRWSALLFNPVALVAIGIALPLLMPEPLQTWLRGAAFNIGWLVAYIVSVVLLWRDPAKAPASTAA